MKAEKYNEMVNHLHWLEGIAERYDEHIKLIEHEYKYYTVQSIGYTARGEGRVFDINPHRPIPLSYIYKGLSEVLSSVNKEIKELHEQLKEVIVEL